jgi:hypothetical protein
MKLYYPSFYSLTIALLSSTLAQAIQISTQTDIKKLNLGDEFTYTVSIDANYSEDALDIRPLFKNFIIGNLRISHSSTNNTTWAIPLQPVVSGRITIPALPIADTKTEPLTIEVNENGIDNTNRIYNASTKLSDNDVSKLSSPPQKTIEMQLSTDSVYIGEILSVNIKIATNSNLDRKALTIESSDGFKVLPIAKPANDKEIFADHYQDTLTYTYELIPEKTGSVSLPRFSLPTKEASTDEQFIDVKPIPDAFHDSNNWRPSAGISIEERWDPQTSYAKLGQPITRTITIIGINNTPDQLPDLLTPDLPYVKIYADSKKIEQENQSGMLISKKTIKHIYIPEKNISFTAPAINISWWNTISNRTQKSSVQERKFIASIIESQKTPSVKPVEKNTTKHFGLFESLNISTIITFFEIGFSISLILMFIIWLFRKSIKYRYERYFLWNKVKRSCLRNESIPTYQSILAWASLYYGSIFTTIEQLPFYIAAKVELDELQATCFSQKSETWRGEKLLRKLSKSSILKIKNDS